MRDKELIISGIGINDIGREIESILREHRGLRGIEVKGDGIFTIHVRYER